MWLGGLYVSETVSYKVEHYDVVSVQATQIEAVPKGTLKKSWR